MKRFDLGQCPCTKYDPEVPSMLETADGDYVLFADLEKEIERLRRVEQAAKNMIKWWEDSGLIYNCGPVEEIRAALEEK